MHPYGTHCRPLLVEQLRALALDACYEGGGGDYLWRRTPGGRERVLDLVGGYGATLFGHAHPELVEYARELLAAGVAGFAQGSVRDGAGRLAEALVRRLGPYRVVLTNSGTETVEAALKHAHLERGRGRYWAVRGSFHGKTLGAVQLTSSHCGPFAGLGPAVRFLDPDDPGDWERAERESGEVAAAFVEPVQGEGGVRPLPLPFLEWLRATCTRAGIPLVADEIQTGMGRTGTFLASQALGLDPDYVCLGKALGGGIAKIGALLVRADRFVPRFAVQHTSTFAEDDFSSLLALRALEILERDRLPERCTRAGGHLLEGLEALRERFPGQIGEVRGKGLMVGVELRPQPDSPSAVLQMLSRQEHLGYFAAAYLLNTHGIRVLPTLSRPLTLRVEPSAYVEPAELERFVGALGTYCRASAGADVAHLVRHRAGVPAGPVVSHAHLRPFAREAPRTPRRVAFIGHLGTCLDAVGCDPSLGRLEREQLAEFLEQGARLLEPAILHRRHVRSAGGREVHLSFVGLAATAEQCAAAARGERAWLTAKIEGAVRLAREAGCRVVGLGGHTSILTGNGRRLRVDGVALTTGNSLTVGMGIRGLEAAARERGIDPAASRVAVVGATGNIASAYALMMAPRVGEMALVVREAAGGQAARLVEELRAVAPRLRVSVGTDVAAVRGCALVVAASSSGGALIHPRHLAPGPVVICDIAVPPDVAPDVRARRPDVLVVQGGLVRLPCDPSFSVPGIGIEPGHVYACLAETLLMGLEDARTHGSYGAVTPQGVRHALEMADRHGFALGGLRLAAQPSAGAAA